MTFRAGDAPARTTCAAASANTASRPIRRDATRRCTSRTTRSGSSSASASRRWDCAASRPARRSAWHGDVVATAKRDLAAGETLDGEGGYTVYGKLVPAADSLRLGASAARPRARRQARAAGGGARAGALGRCRDRRGRRGGALPARDGAFADGRVDASVAARRNVASTATRQRLTARRTCVDRRTWQARHSIQGRTLREMVWHSCGRCDRRRMRDGRTGRAVSRCRSCAHRRQHGQWLGGVHAAWRRDARSPRKSAASHQASTAFTFTRRATAARPTG